MSLKTYYPSKKWYSIAAPIARTALDQVFAAGGSRTAVATNNSNNNMTGVTNDFDRQLQYVRRRMPWRKKKRWVNFVKKVRAVDQSTWQSITTIRNSTMSLAWDDTSQRIACATLYGFAGTTDVVTGNVQTVGNDDIKSIMLASDNSNDAGEEIRFTSGVIDITCTIPTTANTSAANSRVEVDVYEIIFTGMESGVSLVQDYTEGFTVLSTNKPATYGNLTWETRGLTPFENPQASSQGYRVIKKTKYILGQNESFTYQKRNPSNFNVSGAELYTTALQNSTESQYKGKTVNIVFVMKGLPGSDYTGTGNQLNVAIGVTRTYKYKAAGTIERAGGTL